MAFSLTRSAEQDLIDIYVEGYHRFGEARAEAYAARLQRAFALLAEFPELAREREELSPPVRVHSCGVHVILYLVTDTRDVLIVRIRHGREDWLKLPPDAT